MTAVRETGRVVKWRERQGFLQPDYGKGNVALHLSALAGKVPAIGDRFEYEVCRSTRGLYAANVKPWRPAC